MNLGFTNRLNILSGSIYFALNHGEEGLIRADAEERTGNRLQVA